MDDLVSRVVNVTPEQAEVWLGNNIPNNRRIKPTKLNIFSHDMVSGNWRMTGEPIQFDTRGRLIDGQHRLSAIVRTGVQIPLLCVWNVPDEAFPVINTGSARTAGDALSIDGRVGKAQPPVLASVARVHLSYEQGLFSDATSNPAGRYRPLTNQDVINHVIAHPELDSAAVVAERIYRILPIPPSVIGAAVAILDTVSSEANQEFWRLIMDGITTGPGDPLLLLARRVQSERLASGKIRPALGLFILFRCWNAWRDGERLTKLQVTSWQGSIPMPVPH